MNDHTANLALDMILAIRGDLAEIGSEQREQGARLSMLEDQAADLAREAARQRGQWAALSESIGCLGDDVERASG